MGGNDLPFYMADEDKDEAPPALSVCLGEEGEECLLGSPYLK